MSRIADGILCPPLVRTKKLLHLPGCAAIKGARTWPCNWAAGLTLGQVYDSLQATGTINPCRRCDPLFLPSEPSLEN